MIRGMSRTALAVVFCVSLLPCVALAAPSGEVVSTQPSVEAPVQEHGPETVEKDVTAQAGEATESAGVTAQDKGIKTAEPVESEEPVEQAKPTETGLEGPEASPAVGVTVDADDAGASAQVEAAVGEKAEPTDVAHADVVGEKGELAAVQPDALVGWQHVDGRWYLYQPDGTKTTGRTAWAGHDYVFGADGAMLTGWHTDPASGSVYYIYASGVVAADESVASGDGVYHVDAGGARQDDAWVQVGASEVYFGSDGRRASNEWVTTGGKTYYADAGGAKVRSNVLSADGKTYAIRADGTKGASEWVALAGGGWSYAQADGTAPTSTWATIGGSEYYFYQSGRLACDALVLHNGEKALVGSDGRIVREAWVNCDYILDRHYDKGREGHTIERIVLHHMGGNGTVEGCWCTWRVREASAHYPVESSGRIGQLVQDEDTAWHVGYEANVNSIGIEHANTSLSPYHISDECLDSGAHLVAVLCKMYGLGRPEWGVNVFGHSDFRATGCPGSLRLGDSQHDEYMARAQAYYDAMSS